MTRVALVTAGFGPYRVPLWNALAERCELRVLFLAPKEKHRNWEVELGRLKAEVTVARGLQIYLRAWDWALNLAMKDVRRRLTQWQPDIVIVGGYDSPGFWVALSWAKGRGVPVILWSGSTTMSSRARRGVLIDRFKRRFIRDCDAFYAYGEMGAAYLRDYGADANSIVIGTNVPDVERFDRCDRLGDATVPTLLYVGQLIERKGVVPMIEALGRCADLNWRLEVAGDGPLKQELLDRLRAIGVDGRVRYRGYVPQTRLPEVYRAADVLLFPSITEVWGLVVNEALLSGLYVVGSNRAAAVIELVRDGENGESADPLQVNAFAAAVRRALSRWPFNRSVIRATVAHITPAAEAEKIMESVRRAQMRATMKHITRAGVDQRR